MTASAGLLESRFVFEAAQSLRAKGWALFGVVLVFFAMLAAAVLLQRTSRTSEIATLGRIHIVIEALAAALPIVELDASTHTAPRALSDPGARVLARAVAAIDAEPALRNASPSLALARAGLIAITLAPSSTPTSGVGEADGVAQLAVRLSAAVADMEARKAGMESAADIRSDAAVGLMLMILLAAAVTIFLLLRTFMNRLVFDMNAVTKNLHALGAGQAMHGLPVGRRDEVGQLALAVAGFAAVWAGRQRTSVVAQQRQTQREMIETLGAWSQSIAHEVGNPLAGIVGMAQAIHEAKDVRRCSTQGENCHPAVILEQAERISKASRRLTQWADLQREEVGPMNVNELIERVVNLLAFDRRMAGVAIETSLASDVPALNAARSDLAQVLMGILFDAAERARNSARMPASIRLRTEIDAERVCIEIIDTGKAPDDECTCLSVCPDRCAEGRHAHLGLLLAEMGATSGMIRVNDVNRVRIYLPSCADTRAGATQ